MTVRQFIEKWNININDLRIYVTSLEDEVCGCYEIEAYMDSDVIRAYEHNGDTVIQIA